jgi:hypothetical protein
MASPFLGGGHSAARSISASQTSGSFRSASDRCHRPNGRGPALTAVSVRYRGAFAYIDGQLADGTTLPKITS